MNGGTLDPAPVTGAHVLSNGRWLMPRYRKLDGPRPLSPFEEITGERFADHRTVTDVKLDELLAKEARGGGRSGVLRSRVIEAHEDGLMPWEIARAYGITEETVQRYLRPVVPDVQRLWCVTGEHWWTRTARHGSLPWSCPKHPGGRQ